MKLTVITSVLLAAVTATSCNNNKANVLAGLDPASVVYKQKLAKQIDERSNNLTFTFKQCVKVAGKDYLDISIGGNNLHASTLVLVNNWTKLAGIKRSGGLGYNGAELKNLKLSLVNVDSKLTFVYGGLDKIVD